jgi:hypothetical protein
MGLTVGKYCGGVCKNARFSMFGAIQCFYYIDPCPSAWSFDMLIAPISALIPLPDV